MWSMLKNNIPDKDHPVWKIIQSLISLASLLIYFSHTHDSGHVDPSDFIGLLGSGVIAKLAFQFFKG